jgi:hypothetical protein
MVTDAEARKKWCPYAVPFGTEGGNRAKDGAVTSPTCCVGEDCMAWRDGGEGTELRDGTLRGFCGMAGPARP